MENFQTLPVCEIYGNPKQPRTVFDPDALKELSDSIKATTLLQPISVVLRPCELGKYMLIAGERRWRAHKLGGMTEIKAILHDIDDNAVADLALIENLLRRDLNCIEEARAYQYQVDRGHTPATLAKLLGHPSTQRVTDRLSLLNLDSSLQEGTMRGAIPYVQALEMSRLTRENQFALWQAIQDGKCGTTAKLRRYAGALSDAENQTMMFAVEPETPEQRTAISKIDRFIEQAGRLLEMISAEDLAVAEGILRNDAGVCIDRLNLLGKTCYRAANALQTAQTRAEVTYAN
jgi:ParB family transcriptional regulator, chromosome partitioning protein